MRLIDFGIAAPVSPTDERGPREIFGSPGHMPPEQLAGSALSPATDVFAVAVLLSEAWTLKPPFRRRTAEESARALEEAPPSLAGQVPELAALSELVVSCLARDPSERPRGRGRPGPPAARVLETRRFGRRGEEARRSRAEDTRPRAARGREEGARRRVTPVALEVTPPVEGSATRTFAARDEWTAWSRQVETRPSQRPEAGASPGPDTRRLSDPRSLAPESAPAEEPKPRAWKLAAGGALALGLGVVTALGMRPEGAPTRATARRRAARPR